MRRVRVSRFDRELQRKVVVGDAKFHQFGLDYDEYEGGPGTFSTAIVEYDDGQLENVPINFIQFLS
jgi:hypothetical protein